MDFPDTLGSLLGTWRLERAIDDRLAGVRGWFVGTGVFAPSDRGEHLPLAGQARCDEVGWARYDEVGQLCLGTHTGSAFRRLDCVREGSGVVALRFADGSPFVDLDLTRGLWCSTHICGEDSYEITTAVRSADVLEERWRVRGPAKCYDAVTTMVRTTRR